MLGSEDVPRCTRCSRTFTQKSSLIRHEKTCSTEKVSTRQKSCQACARAKVRCNLSRPNCQRCIERSLLCEYTTQSGLHESHNRDEGPAHTSNNFSSSHAAEHLVAPVHFTPESIDESPLRLPRQPLAHVEWSQWRAPRLAITQERVHQLLHVVQDNPSIDIAVRNNMQFVIGALKAWSRRMTSGTLEQLPPMIHRVQFAGVTPTPLSNCSTLVKLWNEHSTGSRKLVQDTIVQEIRRLLAEVVSYGEADLLAAAQSLLVLATVALFGDLDEPALQHPLDAGLLIDLWDVKERLARTGLFLETEHNRTLPPWKEWCLVEAKRRTILSINHVEWCWSLLHGCPVLTCFELGPLPAPGAGHLWRASDETTWQRLYQDYTWRWKDGTYKMTEFWYLDPNGRLDSRTEQWLSDADEFGMMLMAEVSAAGFA